MSLIGRWKVDTAESPRYILGLFYGVCVCLWAESLFFAIVHSYSKSNQKDHFMAKKTGKFKMEIFCNRLVFLTYLSSIFKFMPSVIAWFFLFNLEL